MLFRRRPIIGGGKSRDDHLKLVPLRAAKTNKIASSFEPHLLHPTPRPLSNERRITVADVVTLNVVFATLALELTSLVLFRPLCQHV